ncbi:TVP38/TMEM64 family protein [Cephaloticoccus capnophilus]|nr:TVP38/TMEM64 family protein [Cephaloticoccus capnophilus]
MSASLVTRVETLTDICQNAQPAAMDERKPAVSGKKGPRPRAKKLAVLATFGVGALVVAAWGLKHYGSELGAWWALGLEQVRGAGPLTFFALMVVLPAFGCPLSVFTLTVGPVFGPLLGIVAVLALTLLSVALNLAFSYWLASRALRPVLARLVAWLGYTLPKARAQDCGSLVFLVRVTPGPPFFLQSYLLGIAHIPFRIYFVISWLISGAYACAFVLFGDAVVHGHGKRVMLAVGIFAVLTVGVQWLRRRYRNPREGAGGVTVANAQEKEGAQ